jgi:hypothetical protein
MISRPISTWRRSLPTLLFWPVLAAGQQFSGPISGFVFDSVSGSLRPVLGIAGAAHLGNPILANLDFASVAPNGKRGIAVRNGQVWSLPDLSAGTLVQPVSGAIGQPEQIVWSGDSSTAVLYAPSSNLLQSLSPQGPGPAIDLSPLGALDALAVDGTGQRIAAAIGAAIYLIGPDGLPALVVQSGKTAALLFSKDGARLFAADHDGSRILEIPGAAPGAALNPFLDQNDGVAGPVALGASADGQFLYVASDKNQSVQTYQIPTHVALPELPLDFAPVCIEALSGPAVFRLNVPGEGKTPLLIFDTRAGASVYFVPATAVEGAGQ